MKNYIKIFLGILLFLWFSSSVSATTISYGLSTGVSKCPLGWELIPSQRGLTGVGASGTLTCQLATPRLGVSYGASITYGLNTGSTYCPAGQELLTVDLDRYPGTSGTLTCMRPDTSPPTITVNTNGYINNVWTNQNVVFNITVTDVWTGVKSVVYRINGVQYTGSSSFVLNFEEEGVYNVEIEAEDAITHELLYGNPTTIGNRTVVNYIVKIDKSPPALVSFSTSDTVNWISEKPVITYRVTDTYKGVSIEQKTFVCTGNPTNSEWLPPVESDGSLVGVCDPNSTDCGDDYNFIPNPYHPTLGCRWACSGGFSKGDDNQCYKTTVINSCGLIPTGVYRYNEMDQLTLKDAITGLDNNDITRFWSAPLGVRINGEFTGNFNPNTLQYEPFISQCSNTCFPGTVEEFGNCVNEYATVCCQSSYTLGTFENTGLEVDCSLPINSTHVSCVYNNYCGGYIKDVLKQWDWALNKWQYTDGTDTEDTLADICGAIPIANSNGTTCNPRYYLVDEFLATRRCEVVPIGQFSGQSNTRGNCDSKPGNSTYTTNGTTNNDCEWTCNSGYFEYGGGCYADFRIRSCNSPFGVNNYYWNTVDEITQTWSGFVRTPSRTSTYNTTPSTSQCRYACNNLYSWNGSNCISQISNRSSSDYDCVGTGNGTAYKYCDDLNSGGYTDWRLPTYNEMLNFVGTGNNTRLCMIPSGNCSSNPTLIRLDNGSTSGNCSSDEKVRCVRGTLP